MRLKFHSESEIEDDFEGCFIRVSGELFHQAENGKETLAGRVELIYLDLGTAMELSLDLFDLFDQDASSEEYFDILVDSETGYWKDPLEEAPGNLLILNRLEILPSYRGRKVGLAVLNRCIQQFAHDSLVVLKCWPLQLQLQENEPPTEWQRQLELGSFDPDERAGIERLRTYYSSLGFRSLSQPEFMYLNPEFRHPRLRKLLKNKP
jgi:GNAT superfamily N-acetyltransferase